MAGLPAPPGSVPIIPVLIEGLSAAWMPFLPEVHHENQDLPVLRCIFPMRPPGAFSLVPVATVLS